MMKRMMMRGAGIALMLLTATTAWAEDYLTGVDYMTWSDSEKKLVPAKTPEGVKVWILDGTETTLGTAGTSSALTEAWYIAKGNISYNHYLKNANYCDIHPIPSPTGEGSGAWYDMQGRRIDKPARKGVYIRNGKKIVVK